MPNLQSNFPNASTGQILPFIGCRILQSSSAAVTSATAHHAAAIHLIPHSIGSLWHHASHHISTLHLLLPGKAA
jgi:hypothetical protein